MRYNGPLVDKSTDARKWRCGGHLASKLAYKICVPQGSMQILYVQSDSMEDWHVAQCPPGMTVVSGGCDAHGDPWRFSFNGPHPDDHSRWQCGGHGGAKNVFAVCTPTPLTYHSEQISDWGTAQCPKDTEIVGGGCWVLNGNHEMQLSVPFNYHGKAPEWRCAGQGGNKVAYAICMDASAPSAPVYWHEEGRACTGLNDISDMQSAQTKTSCQAQCDSNPYCLSYEYKPTSASTGQCTLSSTCGTEGTLVDNPDGWTAYVKGSEKPPPAAAPPPPRNMCYCNGNSSARRHRSNRTDTDGSPDCSCAALTLRRVDWRAGRRDRVHARDAPLLRGPLLHESGVPRLRRDGLH